MKPKQTHDYLVKNFRPLYLCEKGKLNRELQVIPQIQKRKNHIRKQKDLPLTALSIVKNQANQHLRKRYTKKRLFHTQWRQLKRLRQFYSMSTIFSYRYAYFFLILAFGRLSAIENKKSNDYFLILGSLHSGQLTFPVPSHSGQSSILVPLQIGHSLFPPPPQAEHTLGLPPFGLSYGSSPVPLQIIQSVNPVPLQSIHSSFPEPPQFGQTIVPTPSQHEHFFSVIVCTNDCLINHFSGLRKYKPRNNVAENIVKNRVNRANHHVRLRFPDSSNNPIAPKKIPYMINIHAPIKNIFFPFILSSKFNIQNLVFNFWEVIHN